MLGFGKKACFPSNGQAEASAINQVPKKVTPPVPLNRWFNDSKSVQELRDLLDKECFQKAVAILKEVAGPSFGTLQDNETNNLRHAWYAGYRDAFNDLHKLTKLQNNQTKTAHPDEWTHIQ
jgi:hypothetical protein|tara:strand:+ start:446 stop:808 length:363 start_codon:yes stop_codon:yes gene_type:complete